MAKVIVYTTKTCPYCTRAKQFLEHKNVAYEEVRIDESVDVQVDVEFTQKLPAGARPDLNVDGRITLERLSNVLYVDRPSYAEGGSETTIFRVLNNSNEAVRIPIIYGRSSVNHIEIIRGLKEGEEVILSDMRNWSKDERLNLE